MKNLFLLIMIIVANSKAQAQIANYFVNESNSNYWDESMKAWRGWGEWNEERNDGDIKFSKSNTITVSPSVIKLEKGFFSWSESESKNVGQNENYTITLTENIPTSEYKMYFDNVKIEYTKVFERSENEYNYSGIGKVYSKDFTFEQLKGGYASGKIYFYINLPNEQFYYGANINSKSTAEVEEEQEEILEQKRQKQKQTNDNIKKIGESLKILLKKN
jgi:hypothetical protein